MCGIAGIHGVQSDSWIAGMNHTQFHRGPDDSGIFEDRQNRLVLAMRRLSIIDLQSGRQPMSTENGRFTIVFNGEIYNAPELRKQLQEEGVSFFTDHSDTEAVLHMYEEYGEGMLTKLNGMFAFAIYDSFEKKIFLARDHAGIKPLYYLNGADSFVFGSELKSLLSLPFVRREIDMQSFSHYLSLQYVPGEDTIIKGIKRIPAGCYAVYSLPDKNFTVKKWWTPLFSTGGKFEQREWAAKIRHEFEQAVNRWILSDVSIGCSLSGGLDSSAIVAALARGGHKVRTYSLGFTGAGEGYWNELPRAGILAKKYGTVHNELVLDSHLLLKDLLSMVWHLDEPYGGGLPSWNVFKFMSRDVKVGLTGTGGDELFGNYGKWKFFEKSSLYKYFVQKNEKDRDINEKDFIEKFFNRFYYFSDELKKKYILNENIPAKTGSFLFDYFNDSEAVSPRDRIANMDLRTQLPEEFLMMTDRFSMAHSLEARTPLLDRKFMELVLSIPVEIRTKPGKLKYLFIESVKDLLPLRLRLARKKGFVIPIKLWLRGHLRGLAEYFLNPDRLKKQGLVSPDFYADFVMPHFEGRRDNTNKIWTMLMFQIWHHMYIEEKMTEEPSYTWESIL